ncbi:MAG: hypothetical protein AMXMBFR33_06080 [Candidatus Xenobia bacterium]
MRRHPNRWGFPDMGLGMALRSKHYPDILESNPPVAFFEVIAENYMGNFGRPMYLLEQVAERYPVMVHGVSLSIGSTDPLDFEYLGLLRNLADRLKVPWVSDHLCWTGVLGRNSHDLLPVPLTEESLRHVIRRIRAVQDFLERPLVVENPSSYVEFLASSMSEAEFLCRMAEGADCGLLLDVNNVYVSAFNHGFDAMEYLRVLPVDRIVYHHVAGHTHKGTHILDTHSDHVVDPVWELYRFCHERTGGRSTMVEWDEDIPPFEVVFEEVQKAAVHRRTVEGDDFSLPERPTPSLAPRREDNRAPHPAGLESPEAGDLFVREKNVEFAHE